MRNNPMNPQDDKQSNCPGLINAMYGEVNGECIDGNCAETQLKLIREHARDCPRCLELLGAEQEVQQLLRQRCGEEAPAELKSRIVQELRVSCVEVRWRG